MNKRTISAEEYNNVFKLATNYVEALRIGRIDMMTKLFYKHSVTYGTVEGKLMGGATNPTIDFIKNYGASPEVVSHINALDITPTTAIRIVMEKNVVGSDCNDYLSFIKLDTEWKIFAKVFHQFDM